MKKLTQGDLTGLRCHWCGAEIPFDALEWAVGMEFPLKDLRPTCLDCIEARLGEPKAEVGE